MSGSYTVDGPAGNDLKKSARYLTGYDTLEIRLSFESFPRKMGRHHGSLCRSGLGIQRDRQCRLICQVLKIRRLSVPIPVTFSTSTRIPLGMCAGALYPEIKIFSNPSLSASAILLSK